MKKIFVFLLPLVIAASVGCNNSSNNSDEIAILYTNDVHGALGGDLSYASVAQMKNDLIHQGKKVLLFDNGDHTSGGLYCSYLDGLPIVNIMNNAGYDAAIFGNHEFDHGFKTVDAYQNFANFPYIATNLYHCTPEDQTPTDPYTNTSYVFDLGNVKVGVIGVSTPYSITSSTPSYFQDDQGRYIYSFLDKNKGQALYDAVQKEVDMLRNEKGCNYVICLSHMGNEELDTHTFASSHLANNTTGIDAILDGHSHIIDVGTTVKNKNNEDVLITQTGSHMKNIGKLTISSQGKISNELIPTYSGKDETVNRLENNIITEVDREFDIDLATSSINFVAHDKDASWLVRRSETNLGDLVADAYYYCLNYLFGESEQNAKCDVTIFNGGAVRADVPSKIWKMLDCRQVLAYDNSVVVKKMKGSVLKIYLEFVTRGITTPISEIGAFPQVQGITFKIDPTEPVTIVMDEKGNYVSGGETQNRIKDLKVYNKTTNTYEVIDLDKEYAVGSSSYILEDCGDGCTMFKDVDTTYRNSSYVDYQVLASYINAFTATNGLPVISTDTSPLKAKQPDILINYENETGSGRVSPLEKYGI